MASSPTQLTMRECKRRGWPSAIVEKWIAFKEFRRGEDEDNGPPGVRKDLFGFIDVVALDSSIIGIQGSTLSTKGEHLKKILASEDAPHWLKSGGRILLWSWRKLKMRKKDGSYSKRYQYQVDEIEITTENFKKED